MRKTIFSLLGLFLLTCMFTGCGGGSKSSSSSSSAYDEETYEAEAYDEEEVSSVNFQSGQQVYTYILGKRFRQGQFRLEIRQEGIYMNGQCVTGALRVDAFEGPYAQISASYPAGGQFTGVLDADEGTLTDENSGDVYTLE
ncbi:MAG: hypothetical protein IKH88_16350 [Prevotella sp.]|nr:hypothetical protein [Prevotella sp.]